MSSAPPWNSGQPPSSSWRRRAGSARCAVRPLESPRRSCRDSAAAGCIRPGSSRRLQARTPNARPRAAVDSSEATERAIAASRPSGACFAWPSTAHVVLLRRHSTHHGSARWQSSVVVGSDIAGDGSPTGANAGSRRRRNAARRRKAGANSAFDRGRQASIDIIACKVKIVPCCRRRRTARQLRRGGAERGAALLDDAGRRHRRGGESERQRDIAPQHVAQLVGRAVDDAVGGADRHRENLRACETPIRPCRRQSRRNGGRRAARLQRKWALTIGA